jgi:TetR/AcrR family transcriptional regulator
VGRPKNHIDAADKIKEHLLKNAAEIFNRKGYSATTVREIVAATGVSKPVLYYYFENKEGIFLEILRTPFEKLKTLVGDSENSNGIVRERLLNLLDRVYVLFRENIGAARLMHAMWYGPSQGAPYFDFETYHGMVDHS